MMAMEVTTQISFRRNCCGEQTELIDSPAVTNLHICTRAMFPRAPPAKDQVQ